MAQRLVPTNEDKFIGFDLGDCDEGPLGHLKMEMRSMKCEAENQKLEMVKMAKKVKPSKLLGKYMHCLSVWEGLEQTNYEFIGIVWM